MLSRGTAEDSACYGWVILSCPPEFLMTHRPVVITNGTVWKGTGLGRNQELVWGGQDSQMCALTRKKAVWLQGKINVHTNCSLIPFLNSLDQKAAYRLGSFKNQMVDWETSEALSQTV